MYNVTVWHNILWSRYKGEVFSSLWNFNAQGEFEFKFIQMAETELDRTVLSSVDLSNHRYQYDLMFKGALDNVPFLAKIKAIFKETLSSQAQLHILTSYEKLETILQMLLIKILGKKFAVFCDSTIHDNPQRFFKGLVKAAIFRSADGIFGYGQRSREYVMHYGASDDKIFIRCQAAALPHDYDREKVAALRLREQSPTPRFLFVGRLHAQKDLPTLILAFSKYLKEKGDGQLVLIGKGPEEDALRALVAELGIEDQVDFLGSRSGNELFLEYSRATAMVLPSVSEPWGLVANEALAYGCPIIVSDHCGCVPELVIHRKTGFAFKTQDDQALLEKMIELTSDEKLQKFMSEYCIEYISKFTPDTAAYQIYMGSKLILNDL